MLAAISGPGPNSLMLPVLCTRPYGNGIMVGKEDVGFELADREVGDARVVEGLLLDLLGEQLLELHRLDSEALVPALEVLDAVSRRLTTGCPC